MRFAIIVITEGKDIIFKNCISIFMLRISLAFDSYDNFLVSAISVKGSELEISIAVAPPPIDMEIIVLVISVNNKGMTTYF
jgi:hypothetical protein